MSSAANKPIGPYCGVYAVEESTAFTVEQWADTDILRALEVTMGDHTRTRESINETRCTRGKHAEALGGLEPVEWSIKARLKGSGTAGTAVPARKTLMESAAGLSETVVGGTSVTYESDVANPLTTVTLYRVSRDGKFGEMLAGAVARQLEYTFKTGEPPALTWSGVAARKYEFMQTTLAAVIADGVVTSMTLTDDAIRHGDEVDSVSGLSIWVKINDEIVKITDFVHSTKVATIVRGEFSTTPAAATTGDAVTPYAESGTYGESGEAVSQNDWTVVDATLGQIKMQELTITFNTGRELDQLESGDIARTSLYNNDYEGTGSFSYIFASDSAKYGTQRALDAGTELDLTVTAGSTAGSIFTLNLDKVRLLEGVPKDLAHGEPTVVTQNFRLRDNIDTFLGQLQHVET